MQQEQERPRYETRVYVGDVFRLTQDKIAALNDQLLQGARGVNPTDRFVVTSADFASTGALPRNGIPAAPGYRVVAKKLNGDGSFETSGKEVVFFQTGETTINIGAVEKTGWLRQDFT